MAKQERIEQAAVCREIGARTGGDILIGVVGPVRTGKSTLIKQFMEKLVLPAIGPEDAKLRARDELPQSAAGRTIMTTEPKFIPESAVPLALEGGGECSIRLIDCVGYMVEGAMGHEENDKPRMVKSPWFDEEIPFDLAAETGTRKVIRDHSTIGIVVTTDGTISEIPRENYIPAEKRVIDELEALGKPFVILLNSTHPDAPETRAMAAEMEESYGRTVLAVSCLDLDETQLGEICKSALRVPGEGAGFRPAPLGDDVGQRPLAPDRSIHSGHAALRENFPDEGRLRLRPGGVGLRGRGKRRSQWDEPRRRRGPHHGAAQARGVL